MVATAFRIGGDLEVRRLGFGAMRLGTEPGPVRENSLAVARKAVELGITAPVRFAARSSAVA